MIRLMSIEPPREPDSSQSPAEANPAAINNEPPPVVEPTPGPHQSPAAPGWSAASPREPQHPGQEQQQAPAAQAALPGDPGESPAEANQPAVDLPIPMPPRTAPPATSAYGKATLSPQDSGQFLLVLPQVRTIVSGPAVGGMIAGIAGVIVALLGIPIAGLAGVMLIAVSVLVLTLFCGAAAVSLGGVALRQIKQGAGDYRGRGMAIAGIVCGGLGVVMAIPLFLAVLILSQ